MFQGSAEEVDVILVGGGSVLIDEQHPPAGVTIVKPQFCQASHSVAEL